MKNIKINWKGKDVEIKPLSMSRGEREVIEAYEQQKENEINAMLILLGFGMEFFAEFRDRDVMK